MNKFYALAALGAALIALGAGCRLFSDRRPQAQTLAERFELGPEWRELVPAAPLGANREIQFVGLALDGVAARADGDAQKLFAGDGRELRVEVELVDAAGAATRLDVIGVGRFVEFGTGRPLPEGVSYRKVRLKSSEKITAGEIVWGDSSMW